MMNCQRKALSLSLALHGLLIGGVYTISASFINPGRPVVIDFTMVDSAEAPQARRTGVAKEATLHRQREVVARKVPAERRTETVKASEPEPVPRPATETRGPAPQKEVLSSENANSPAAEPGGSSPSSDSDGRTTVSGVSGHGAGVSSEQRGERYRKEHYTYIKTLIENNIRYPARARRMGWSGRVVVMFEVMGDGRVENIRVKESSGQEILDRNVIDTIRTVQPFPRPPEWVLLSIPISYRLN